MASNIPTVAPNYLDLLKAGTHYSEKRGQHIHIVDVNSGLSTLVLSANPSNMVQLVQQESLTGEISWIEAGISNLTVAKQTEYNPLVLQLLCQRIAEGGSLTKICKDSDMPTYTTLAKWRLKYPEVREMLEQAYVDRADTLRDNALDAALAADEDNVDSQKLKHDAYKWAAGVDSTRYSPKAKIEANIQVPTQIVVQTGIDRTPVQRDVTESDKTKE